MRFLLPLLGFVRSDKNRNIEIRYILKMNNITEKNPNVLITVVKSSTTNGSNKIIKSLHLPIHEKNGCVEDQNVCGLTKITFP